MIRHPTAFTAHPVLEIREAGDIAARVGHTFDEASTNRIGNVHEHDRDSKDDHALVFNRRE
jgi:hypothetical protein